MPTARVNLISSWPNEWDNYSMPFTLAHPAAVLPFRRMGFVFSALVIGSMAPDFNNFFPYMPGRSFTHSIPAIFLFCIPIGFAVLLIFHKLIKIPFLSLLPEDHRRRLLKLSKDFGFLPLRQILIILLSIFLGVVTHLLWDSFTHLYGWGVVAFPFFQQPLFHLGGRSIALFSFLQYLSGVVGLVIIGFWYWKWYRQASPGPDVNDILISGKVKTIILIIMLLTTILAAILSALISIPDVQSLHEVRLFASQFAVITISTLLGEIVIYSLWWHYKNHKRSFA